MGGVSPVALLLLLLTVDEAMDSLSSGIFLKTLVLLVSPL